MGETGVRRGEDLWDIPQGLFRLLFFNQLLPRSRKENQDSSFLFSFILTNPSFLCLDA